MINVTTTDIISKATDRREFRLLVDASDLAEVVADRDRLFEQTSRLASELEDVARGLCGCKAGFDNCHGEHCIRRREIIADAYTALTGGAE